MFALWFVPVDQNPGKSVLTTAVVGMLLALKKNKEKKKSLNAL